MTFSNLVSFTVTIMVQDKYDISYILKIKRN